jgi:hypothetical protein
MPDRPLSSIWWMHPAAAFGIPTGLVAISALAVSPNSYDLYWRTGKFVRASDIVMALTAIAVFGLGTLAAAARSQRRPASGRWADEIPWARVRSIFNFCFFSCIVGYTLWAIVGVRNGLTLGTVMDALRGNDGAMYDVHLHYLVPVAGVTSLTQFGIAAVAFGIPLGIAEGWTGVRWKVATIIALGMFRALINSERLGFIELAVPCMISYLWHKSARTVASYGWKRVFIQSLPIAAAVALFVVFSLSEYWRSWLNFYAAREDSFLRFAGLRLIGYYTTAFNNGTLLIHSLVQPLGGPYFTATFARHFPILNSAFDAVFPVSVSGEDLYAGLLSGFANPEMTNPSGIFLPVADYGPVGALIYWLICGTVCGYLYGSFRHYSPAGMFLYPVLFTSLLETPRILYWADGRAFPALFIILFSTVFVLHRPRQTSGLGPRVPVFP